jgi:phosphatidylinositol-3-phosphatase
MRNGGSSLWKGLRTWNETGRTFSPAQMRALALLSALSTGLVIWAGFARGDSNSLAAAIAQRRLLARSAAASQPAAASPGAHEEPSSGAGAEGESESSTSASEAAQPAAQATTTSSGTEASESAGSEATTPTPTTTPSKTPQAATPAGTKIKHVFVITLASPGYEQTWGPNSAAHYLTTQLRPQGTLLSDYYGVGHFDLPNYIAMISGQPPNQQTSADCPTFASFPANAKPDSAGLLQAPGCVYPTSVLTLGDQLTSSRHQWRGYAEDLAAGPKPVQSCRHPSTDQPDETQRGRPGDGYAARHNPFVYFHSLLDLGDCAADDIALTQLPGDLASDAKTANYSFIVPNLCHDGSESPCADGSPGGLAAADAFLAEWVPKILASPSYKTDGLLVVTFSDGPASDTSGCCDAGGAAVTTSGGGRVGALLVSRYVAAGGESKTPYNHYSLLRTVEDIFGLTHLGEAGRAGVTPFSDVLKGVLPQK